MHPVNNIRGSLSDHLAGKTIVLAVSGSIAAIKTVELARELIRHGATVHGVMSQAAQGILTPASLAFGTGNPVITELTGAVEHVALLGDVPERADLFLVAPATANTVGKMAWGIDDTVVTTCATVAFGTGVPVVVAPAMHDAMMHHPKVQENIATLRDQLGVTWVEPKVEEKKAKLAEIDAIVDAVIHRLAVENKAPLAGKRCLVVGGATAEPVDPIRILTNRSSGQSAIVLATELHRLGATVDLWYGASPAAIPATLAASTKRFQTHSSLLALVDGALPSECHEVWMPAAIADYVPEASDAKIGSEQAGLSIPLHPVGKVAEAIRAKLPDATLIAFKAESDADPAALIEKARSRLHRYGARYIVANHSSAFGADSTTAHLVDAKAARTFEGPKEEVLREIVRAVAEGDSGSPLQVAP